MKTTKETYLLKANCWRKLTKEISIKIGLPEVSSSLGVYFDHCQNNFKLKFLNSDCYFKTYDKNSVLDNRLMNLFRDTPKIKITNKNIKFFLRSLSVLGLNRAYISEKVTNIKFKNHQREYLDLNLNTPVGDLLILRNQGLKKIINKKYIDKKLNSDEIDALFKQKIKMEDVFNDLGILNTKIIKYADEFGIDLTSSGRSTIEDRLKIKSNDYSDYESIYEAVIGRKINAGQVNQEILRKYFKPLSIVISSFNSGKTIIDVLKSIESQDLDSKQKKLLNVIVIDDGSKKPVSRVIKRYNFSFEVSVVRLEENKGLSNARNIGVVLAKYNKILFIDSDILLSHNYLLEHSIVLQMFPSAIFVSMKNNIAPNSMIRKKVDIGVPISESFNDKRMIRVFKKKQPWINNIKNDGIYEVISETDYFRSFGYKKTMGGYDLPSMVVGHNMSLDKKLILSADGFSSHFIGWGLEDVYFGAKIISSGAFVIPIIKTGVFHINHPPRSGSLKKQEQEYKRNLSTYKRLTEKEFDEKIY